MTKLSVQILGTENTKSLHVNNETLKGLVLDLKTTVSQQWQRKVVEV